GARGGVREELKAAFFQYRLAHRACVDGNEADTALASFVEPRADQRRVQTPMTELGNGRAAPQAGERAAGPKTYPAARGWCLAKAGNIDRQRLSRVVHLVGESVQDILEAFAVHTPFDRPDLAELVVRGDPPDGDVRRRFEYLGGGPQVTDENRLGLVDLEPVCRQTLDQIR